MQKGATEDNIVLLPNTTTFLLITAFFFFLAWLSSLYSFLQKFQMFPKRRNHKEELLHLMQMNSLSIVNIHMRKQGIVHFTSTGARQQIGLFSQSCCKWANILSI